jgi:hypothetical protein
VTQTSSVTVTVTHHGSSTLTSCDRGAQGPDLTTSSLNVAKAWDRQVAGDTTVACQRKCFVTSVSCCSLRVLTRHNQSRRRCFHLVMRKRMNEIAIPSCFSHLTLTHLISLTLRSTPSLEPSASAVGCS